MPKKKKRATRAKRGGRKNNRKPTPQHSLPDGFWPQVTALVLVILALLLTLGMMSSGGPLPEATWNLGRYLLGWAAFILPILFIFRAVQIFRAEDNLVPTSVSVATIIFAVLAGGFIQLMSSSPVNLALAEAGNGGGVVGWLVAKATLLLVSAGVGALIVFLILIVTSLFVLSISPDKLLNSLVNLFKRDIAEGDAANAAVAAKVKADEPVSKGEFKLNEGVPTTMSTDESKPASKLSTFAGSIKPDKVAEDQAALTSSGDPDWQAPSLDLLEKKQNPADAGDVKHNAQIIKDTLAEFNIGVDMEGANIGPKVTQYTLRPPSGVKLTRITALETNIALNLAAQALRIEAPIPGQRAVGIEVPNRKAADVRLYGILNSKQWQSAREPLSFAIGKDISGDAVVGELNKMPHLMIAGQTGSGKSVMINTLLSSLLYRNSPADMRLILVDPKQVEMAPYEDIPHLLTPIITEPEKCISALKWAVNEMERRYSLLAEEKLRDIASYNRKKKEEAMPYVVIVIDELADLMMVAARDVEALIVRLAQKARAVGIHLVLATQRPSVNVITGLIKANIPARIAFTV
ncbi:MAG TPA: DNA translocase FtsK 4TM domain-containing protein, partial [Candidatus Saccharimonadales bacterium]|nr:DNA translocase FtsK 4TM domain-containing protein [Candidatus Saccharimonadales bacterium]